LIEKREEERAKNKLIGKLKGRMKVNSNKKIKERK
jgi:hypothetical protein